MKKYCGYKFGHYRFFIRLETCLSKLRHNYGLKKGNTERRCWWKKKKKGTRCARARCTYCEVRMNTGKQKVLQIVDARGRIVFRGIVIVISWRGVVFGAVLTTGVLATDGCLFVRHLGPLYGLLLQLPEAYLAHFCRVSSRRAITKPFIAFTFFGST